MMTTQRWTYSVMDAYTDEYATERDFSSFADAVAWAKERDLDPDQFAVVMWDDNREQMRILSLPR